MGSSKKQTVGYKYYLGLHKILCHGPIDLIKRISVDKREAWSGITTGGNVSVVNESLLGGTDREGGINASIDFDMGGSTQGQNDYLQSQLGTDIPAYRGVVGAIFRKAYLSMNPYLKPWSFRGQRVYTAGDGGEQWNKGKAGIGGFADNTEGLAFYIVLDTSTSMDAITGNGQSRLTNAKGAIQSLLSSFQPLIQSGTSLDLLVGNWGSMLLSETYYDVDQADLTSASSFVGAITTAGQTSTTFASATSGANAFFSGVGSARKIVIFMTDGEPSGDATADANAARAALDAIPNVETYAINIDLGNTTYSAIVDNTAQDGVPVVSGDGDDILSAIIQGIAGQVDMNPAHILWECLTNAEWGLGYLVADLDEDSFLSAADTLFAEAMGMSLLWDRQIPVQEFIQEIIRHINGVLDIDKSSGKFKLSLVRNDYVEADLLVLDESNILKVKEYSREAVTTDQVNSVTVKFWNYITGEEASVNVDDIALIQEQGAVVGTTVQYPGFTRKHLATQAAQRDLRTFSTPLLSATITANREASVLTTGSVFKFYYAKGHPGYVVMRVLEIGYGSSKSNIVQIKAIEDIFSLPTNVVIAEEADESEDISAAPIDSPIQVAEEAMYYELVQNLGQTDADTKLTANNDIGFISVSCSSPTGGSINYNLSVDDGSGYEESSVGDFSPSMVIPLAITDKRATVFTYEDGTDLSNLELGVHGYLNGEIVRLDAINTGTSEITIGRGCLDSVPLTHDAESPILWWDEYITGDEVEYITSESVNVKMLVSTGTGVLSEADASTKNITMDSRAFRPYPPADFKLNDEYFPASLTGQIEVTWVERNRLQQTGAAGILDFEDATVTPEEGTTYQINVIDTTDDSLVISYDNIVGTSYSIPTTDLLSSVNNTTIRIEVFSVRDTYLSRVPQSHDFMWSGTAGIFDLYTENTNDYDLTEDAS